MIRLSSIPPKDCEAAGELPFEVETSTLNRPIIGLVVCPLASQTNTPDPRAAARNIELGPPDDPLLFEIAVGWKARDEMESPDADTFVL